MVNTDTSTTSTSEAEGWRLLRESIARGLAQVDDANRRDDLLDDDLLTRKVHRRRPPEWADEP